MGIKTLGKKVVSNISNYYGLYLYSLAVVGCVSMVGYQSMVAVPKLEKATTLQTKNVLGARSTPEKFYVVNGDTAYIEMDGKPVRDYFPKKPFDIEAYGKAKKEAGLGGIF